MFGSSERAFPLVLPGLGAVWQRLCTDLESVEFARSLPLPDETPEIFRMLPEFLIEDITEFLSFTSK